VLLPAPFSPMRARTSPCANDRDTLRSATTPGKRLVIPRIDSRLVLASTLASLQTLLQLGELVSERLHVFLVDDRHAGVDDLVVRDGLHGLLSLGGQVVRPFRRLVAELEGLLDHGRRDGTFGDAFQGSFLLLEARSLDL